jgi:hypothetical protein
MTCSQLWRDGFTEGGHEEGHRAALDGPEKVGAGESLNGSTAPTSDNNFAPVLELVDSRDLHSRGLINHSGPTPDRGTISFPGGNFCDIRLRCRKKP